MADSTTATGYAIVETGGKQYRVSVGDKITVEKLDSEAGSEITLDKVLLVGGAAGSQIGAPYVSGASVTATVDAQGKGEKIVVFKYVEEALSLPHRSPPAATQLTITGINAQAATAVNIVARRGGVTMAHKKGVGSSRNGRQPGANDRRRADGEVVRAGTIVAPAWHGILGRQQRRHR